MGAALHKKADLKKPEEKKGKERRAAQGALFAFKPGCIRYVAASVTVRYTPRRSVAAFTQGAMEKPLLFVPAKAALLGPCAFHYAVAGWIKQ